MKLLHRLFIIEIAWYSQRPFQWEIMADVTRILEAITAGEEDAGDRLLRLVYSELNRLAARKLADANPGNSLCTTDLVHEAYIRLLGSDSQLSFENARHFFGAASRAMRHVLVDAARRRGRTKRGGAHVRVELADVPAVELDDQLLALDGVLDDLESHDPVTAEVVNLHHFGGLSYEKTAELLGVSVYEVRQKWSFARAWLSRQLK